MSQILSARGGAVQAPPGRDRGLILMTDDEARFRQPRRNRFAATRRSDLSAGQLLEGGEREGASRAVEGDRGE